MHYEVRLKELNLTTLARRDYDKILTLSVDVTLKYVIDARGLELDLHLNSSSFKFGERGLHMRMG